MIKNLLFVNWMNMVTVDLLIDQNGSINFFGQHRQFKFMTSRNCVTIERIAPLR